MTNLQLLVIEGDPIFRLGLRFACEQHPDLQVVAEVESGSEALNAIAALGDENTPNLVIWNLDVQILPSDSTEQDFSPSDDTVSAAQNAVPQPTTITTSGK